MTRADSPAELADARAEDARRFGEIVREAFDAVLNDRAAWACEAARRDAERLPFPTEGPHPEGAETLGQLLRIVAVSTLTQQTAALKVRALDHLGWEASDDAVKQLVLMVVKRAADALLVALVKEWGGEARLPLKRELLKQAREAEAEAARLDALQQGERVGVALAGRGVSRASGYRALKRATDRRRRAGTSR